MWQINRAAPSLCQIHSTHFSTCHSSPSCFLLSLSAAAIPFLPSLYHAEAPHKDGVDDRNNGA